MIGKFCLKNNIFIVQIFMGTHYYVQLTESKVFLESNPSDLDSVELVMPTGAAVPEHYRMAYMKHMRNLKVVLNAYGATEMVCCSINTNSESLGVVLPGITFKVKYH